MIGCIQENKDTTVELQLGSKKTHNTLIFVRLTDNRTTITKLIQDE